MRKPIESITTSQEIMSELIMLHEELIALEEKKLSAEKVFDKLLHETLVVGVSKERAKLMSDPFVATRQYDKAIEVRRGKVKSLELVVGSRTGIPLSVDVIKATGPKQFATLAWLMLSNGHYSMEELEAMSGRSRKEIQKDMQKLEKLGLFTRVKKGKFVKMEANSEGEYIKIYESIINISGVNFSSNEKIIFLTLVSQLQRKGNDGRVTDEYITRKTGMSKSVISRTLMELERRGVIIIHKPTQKQRCFEIQGINYFR